MSHRLIIPVTLAALLLTGCATAPQEETLKLVETKTPVQLMRNAVSERVPAEVVGFVSNSGDDSEECGDGDPYRLWTSSVNLTLTSAEAPNARAHYEDLVATYVADGWKPDEPEHSSTRLVREETEPEIVVTVQDYTAISVTIKGECVLTDGEGSAEVTTLERAGS